MIFSPFDSYFFDQMMILCQAEPLSRHVTFLSEGKMMKTFPVEEMEETGLYNKTSAVFTDPTHVYAL